MTLNSELKIKRKQHRTFSVCVMEKYEASEITASSLRVLHIYIHSI